MKRLIFLLLWSAPALLSAQDPVPHCSVKTNLLPEFIPYNPFGYRILNLAVEAYFRSHFSAEVSVGSLQKVVPDPHGQGDPLPYGGVFYLDRVNGTTVSAAGHFFFRNQTTQNALRKSYVGLGGTYLHMNGAAHKKHFTTYGLANDNPMPIASEISKVDFIYGIEFFPQLTQFCLQLEAGISVGRFYYYVNSERSWQHNFQPFFSLKVGGFA